MISVLYVDDEPALLEIGKTYLEKSGTITVDTSNSAADAQLRLAESHYDAIISDYQMPVTDGIEFLKYIRTSHGDLPFILFTGRGREEVVMHFQDQLLCLLPKLKGFFQELSSLSDRVVGKSDQ